MARATTTSDAFNAVAEPRRRAILELLLSQEQPVGAIGEALRMPQPSVSKHLRVLHEVGLVAMRRDGRQVFYRTNAEPIQSLHNWTRRFEHYWKKRLIRIKDRAERQGVPGADAKPPRRQP